MKNIADVRSELSDLYQDWSRKIFANAILRENNISLPYYIYLPDNWTDSKVRILIVGEEGYGHKGCDRDRNVTAEHIIETVQEFNKNCMFEWKMNNRPFWRRFNKLREHLPDASFCWTNLDKVHRLIDPSAKSKSCKLTALQRNELHKYPVLQAETDIIKPTLFFSAGTGILYNVNYPKSIRNYMKTAGNNGERTGFAPPLRRPVSNISLPTTPIGVSETDRKKMCFVRY